MVTIGNTSHVMRTVPIQALNTTVSCGCTNPDHDIASEFLSLVKSISSMSYEKKVYIKIHVKILKYDCNILTKAIVTKYF